MKKLMLAMALALGFSAAAEQRAEANGSCTFGFKITLFANKDCGPACCPPPCNYPCFPTVDYSLFGLNPYAGYAGYAGGYPAADTTVPADQSQPSVPADASSRRTPPAGQKPTGYQPVGYYPNQGYYAPNYGYTPSYGYGNNYGYTPSYGYGGGYGYGNLYGR